MHEDTQPIPPVKPQGWDWNNDGVISELETKTPSPAVVRAVLFAIANLVGLVVGRQFFDPVLIDQIINVYAVAGPVLLGLWIKKATG